MNTNYNQITDEERRNVIEYLRRKQEMSRQQQREREILLIIRIGAVILSWVLFVSVYAVIVGTFPA